MDVCERLDKGLLDFVVLLGDIDKMKYHYMELPMKDTWGVLMRADSPLAEKAAVSPEDLHTVATYNLIYNASLMVDEGMGYAFTLNKLVNTRGSNLCFRPLEPGFTLGMYLVWKKSQRFSKAAELFLEGLKEHLAGFGEVPRG